MAGGENKKTSGPPPEFIVFSMPLRHFFLEVTKKCVSLHPESPKKKAPKMQQYTYQTSGTCSVQINFEIDDQGRLHNVQYLGGCDGNLQGIGRLAPQDLVRAAHGRLADLIVMNG
jgi:hypothetical protein